MTTITIFQPPPNNLFSFQPTLDGQICAATVWWNTDGQRWYVSVAGPDGSPIFNLPLIGSPTPKTLTSLSWSNGIVTATTQVPHGFTFFSLIDLTVAGCLPDQFNGHFRCFVTDLNKFTYQLDQNPGPLPATTSAEIETSDNDASLLGAAGYDINMGGGYLQQSTFVYREQSNTFEVSP